MPARCRRRGCRSASRLLLNLVAVASTDDKDLLWGFVQRYAPEASPETPSRARRAARLRARLFPRLHRRFAAPPRADARWRRRRCAISTRGWPRCREDADAETIQTEVYEVGKAHPFESLRDWFKALYETLLGTSQGPRMGSFIALYGIDNSRKLIAEALARTHP